MKRELKSETSLGFGSRHRLFLSFYFVLSPFFSSAPWWMTSDIFQIFLLFSFSLTVTAIVCPYPLCPVTCKKPSKNFDHHIASHGPPETWKLDQIVKEVQTEVEEDGRGNPRMQVHHEEFQDDLPPLSLSPFQNHLLSRESFSSSGSSPSSSSAASSSAASGMTSSSSQSTEFDFMSPASSPSAPRPSILNRPFMNSYASLQQSFMNQDPSLDQENYYNQSHLGLKPAAKINENFSHQNPHHDFNYQSLDFDFSSSKGLIYHHRQDSMSSNQGSGHLNWHQHQQQYQYQTPPQTNVNSHYPSRVNYSYENNGTLGLKGADEEAEQSFGFRS